MMTRMLIAAIATATLAGCVREVVEPQMFQPAYAPNRQVDVYYSDEDVAQGGKEIGEITIDTSHGWAVDMVYKRLLDTARARGANAVVISGLTEAQVKSAENVSGAKQIIQAEVVSGRLIRYDE